MVEVQRATFEKIYNAQLELIYGTTGIDVLAKKNETVHPDSRRVWNENVAIALVGQGIFHRVTLKTRTEEYDLGSVSEFIHKIAYYEDTAGNIQMLILNGKEKRFTMTELWVALRDSLWIPLDKALMIGIQYSSEIFRSDGGPGFVFDPDTYKPTSK